MKYQVFIASLLLQGTVAAAPVTGADAPDPFRQPTINYLKQFEKPAEKIFVYERYNAAGELTSRVVEPLKQPVIINSVTERTFGQYTIRLRGLATCPTGNVQYEGADTQCDAAAKDYQDAIYNGRASVILCKTLLLERDRTSAEPASCFALVGSGSKSSPNHVAYDDDAMVFMNMAVIGRNKAGKSLRPDLEHSSHLGKQFQ